MYSLTDPQLCSTYGASSEYERGPFFFALLLRKISLVVDSCYFLAEALVLYCTRLY